MNPILLPTMPEPDRSVHMTPLEFARELVLHAYAQNRYAVPDRILALVGAEGGEPPAGVFQSSDAIAVVPGTNVTVDGQSLDDIFRELVQWLGAFNRQADAVVAMLTFETDREREQTGVYTNPGFQDASEFGEPSKINLKYVFRGFPLRHKDLAIGFTREFLDRARGREVRGVRITAEAAWRQLLKEHTLEALFGPTNYTSKDGVNVVRLFNNDGEVPPPYKRWTHLGTHTHYLTSGAASFDAADIDAMEEHIIHHVYGDFGEALVAFQHRDELAVSRGLAEWVPAETSNVPQVTTGPIVGLRPPGAGNQVQGFLGRFAIVQMDDLPQGYHLGWATGGAFAERNPVGFRVHENAAARGLRLTPGPNGEYPLIDAVYDGYVGAGIAHRGAAVVMQNTAGAYTAPSFSL